MNYFEIYERNIVLCDLQEGSYCKRMDRTTSVLSDFCAYCILKGIAVTDWSRLVFEEFVNQTIGGEGDCLVQMLSAEDPGKRRALVECYYELENIAKELKAVKLPDPPAEDKRNTQAQAILAPGVVEKLFGISITEGTRVLIHVSSAAPYSFSMHTFPGLGVLLAAGKDGDIPAGFQESEQTYPEVFKALADESRFKMVRALLKEPLTVSELAGKVGLTLSTVNHHIKVLMMAGIVRMETKEVPGRGVRYALNDVRISHMLQEISNVLKKENL